MTPPPVSAFRLLSLPVKERSHFGAWLNVCRDAHAAVCVMAADPYASVDAALRQSCRVLYADAIKGIRLCGTTAVLIAAEQAQFLDAAAQVEQDYDLPRGVESRRSPNINASIYWVSNLTPETVDEHIAYAKRGGFRMMLLYYTCMFRETGGYALCGNYDYRPEYPDGKATLAAMLQKLRAAGITPGLHVLQTHIGLKSRYVTPKADHRLHLTRHFTLAKPLPSGDISALYVEENPADTVMAERCRVLQFGGELITYQSYTTTRPYRFEGIQRGAYDTEIRSHPLGEIGGILDVSEFGASSVYLDQDSSLADEIAEKIADVYNAGFGFLYFDGSEGTNAPFAHYVPMGQYRVWQRLEHKPLFTEGAAKAHFSWHHLSGGNAFDIFPPEIFKEKLVQFPVEEAPRMQTDFTRLNFGWWGFLCPSESSDGTQADQYEYGTSRAAGWDCPATIQFQLDALRAHPRTDDILEVMRRWEDMRSRGLLTDAQKAALRNPAVEHHLLIDAQGDYVLVPWEQLSLPQPHLRAFCFSYHGAACAALWHTKGSASVALPLDCDKLQLFRDLRTAPIPLTTDADGSTLVSVADRVYLLYHGSMEALQHGLLTMTQHI